MGYLYSAAWLVDEGVARDLLGESLEQCPLSPPSSLVVPASPIADCFCEWVSLMKLSRSVTEENLFLTWACEMCTSIHVIDITTCKKQSFFSFISLAV